MNLIIALVVICLIILTIIILLLRLIYKAFAKQNKGRLGLVIVTGIAGFLIFKTYTAFYPLDGFYFDDFKGVIYKEIPHSADILSKSTTFPDFHGSHCSSSIMQLSADDYRKLLRDMKSDNRFKRNIFGWTSPSDEMMNTKKANVADGFQNEDGNYIGFLKDGRTIFVQYCGYAPN